MIKIHWTNRIGMPNYDDMLADPAYFRRAKGVTFKIVDMPAYSYLTEAAEVLSEFTGKQISPFSGIRDAKLEKIKNLIKSNMPIDMLMINYKKLSQEGRNRAYAIAQLNGISYPVRVVEVYNYP